MGGPSAARRRVPHWPRRTASRRRSTCVCSHAAASAPDAHIRGETCPSREITCMRTSERVLLPPFPAPSLLHQPCEAPRTRCSERVDDKAAYGFSANCGEAAYRVCTEDGDTSLAEEVKAVPGLSQSVLNGLHQCVIAITRSLQRPQQDELYSVASQLIFFFLPPPQVFSTRENL